MSKTPNFPVLQDTADGDGKPWHLVAENDAVAARNMGGVAIAKNASNQFRVPAVDTQDRLIVNSEADDIVDLKGEGDDAGSGTFVTLFDITLQNSMDYKNLEWVASCFRDTTFEIVHIADLGGSPVETILATPKVGSGSFTSFGKLTSRFTSGATGVQVVRFRGINLTSTSQMEASASLQEVQ